MDDLISRQAAIEAVSEACFELRGVFGRCEDALKALPSAQPEIIRCKDCESYLSSGLLEYDWCCGWDGKTTEDSYCSYAERRTNV